MSDPREKPGEGSDKPSGRPDRKPPGLRDVVDRAVEWLADLVAPAPVPVPVPVRRPRR